MRLTCTQCETIVRVNRLRLHLAKQPIHCMICDHIWTAWLVTSDDRQDMPNFASYFHKIRLQVIVILICAGLMTSLNREPWHSNHLFPRTNRKLRSDWSSNTAAN